MTMRSLGSLPSMCASDNMERIMYMYIKHTGEVDMVVAFIKMNKMTYTLHVDVCN